MPGTTSGLMLALIAYPAALAYLTGGPDQLRRWFRAKFLNQTATDAGIRSEAWVIPSTFASSSSSPPTAALTSYRRHRAPAPAPAATSPASPPRPAGANSYNAITGKWGSTAGHAAAPAGGGKGAVALAFARSQLGKPYRWGGTGPNVWDCSGLTQAAWRAAGVRIPRTTGLQLLTGRRVTRAQLAEGDLVFPFSGHVQLYAGGGQVIEAPRTGLRVRTAPLGRFLTARRPG